jgi:hypothetical protein
MIDDMIDDYSGLRFLSFCVVLIVAWVVVLESILIPLGSKVDGWIRNMFH